MLESFRKGRRWLTIIFIATIGLVFVFFFGTGGGLQGSSTPSGNAIIELDDLRLTSIDFAREKERVEDDLRARLGDAYDEVGADQYVDSQALNSLLSSVILAAAARELGLHVTKDEIRRMVQASPGFINDEGKFDPEAFDFFARRNFGNQRLFIQHFTRQVLQQKLVQLLVAQTDISDSEIDLVTRYEKEEIRIAFVQLDPETQAPAPEVSDSDIEVYLADHTAQVEAIYEERAETLAQPDRVKARHILIRAELGSSSEVADEARQRAKAARDRVLAGEDFAVVAAEVSEDEGTAESGGELGTFAKGANNAAIDDTAFALEAGEVSEVIRSPNGFHVVQIDEKFAASTPTFEELRMELGREALINSKATEWVEQQSSLLAQMIDAGSTLEDAARESGLTLERPPAIHRRPDGFIAGLGAAQEVMSASFALEPGESSREVFEIAGKRVMVQVLERSGPSEEELAVARVDRREQLRIDKQNRAVSAWLDEFRTRLENSGRLKINAALALGS